MNTKNLILGFFILGLNTARPDSPATPPTTTILTEPATNDIGSRIQFATSVYDFGRVKAGELVKYSFVFTNTGDQVLEVSHVQPSCGCTTAGEWSKRVEAGKTGSIAIQFNSANFNGPVFKTISVTSNDKHSPSTVLQLKGTVWKPVEFSPAYTIITIPPDANGATNVVRIINNMGEPLEIWSPESSLASFKAQLQTNQPGKEFQITISSVPPLAPGSLNGKVTFQTSATNLAKLEMPFWATVQAPVLVLPQQLVLPASPLAAKTTHNITIQNQSTNLQLVISDAAINVPGAEVQLKEMVPGKTFSAQLSFPEGFEIPAGQQVVFTAKSSNPNLPLIKVPITQSPKGGIQSLSPPKFNPNLPPQKPFQKTQPTATPGEPTASPTAQANH